MDEDLLGGLRIVPVGCLFDEFAVVECRSGSDEGDQLWCVDGSPPGLGGFDELERHGQTGGAGTGAVSDLDAGVQDRWKRADGSARQTHLKPTAYQPLESGWRIHVAPRWAAVRLDCSSGQAT